MKKFFVLFLFFSTSLLFVTVSAQKVEDNWPQWRGPLGNGIVPKGDPPLKWTENHNIKWKVSIPGLGLATPVVWGRQILIQTAVESKDQSKAPKIEEQKEEEQGGRRRRMRGKDPNKVLDFMLISVDKNNGKILWQKTLNTALPHEATHNTGSWASGSPVTDGKNIYSYFGSFGLYCLDMKGKLKWKKDFGDMHTRNAFGEGSSPVLYQDRIFILWDHEGDSFITALDKNTGRVIWKKERDESTSWSTPLILKLKDGIQVLVNGTTRIRSYAFENGDLIWEAEGMTRNVIPSPVYNKNMVYFTSGFRGSALLAVNTEGAKGNIMGTKHALWTHDKNTPYTPSPLFYKGNVYISKVNRASITVLKGDTGELVYGPERLEKMKGIYASPIGVKDRVYYVGRNGVTYVLKAGDKFEILSVNDLDDEIDASPVVVGNDLILRGRKYLYCIGK